MCLHVILALAIRPSLPHNNCWRVGAGNLSEFAFAHQLKVSSAALLPLHSAQRKGSSAACNYCDLCLKSMLVLST